LSAGIPRDGDDHWDVLLSGQTVNRICVDYAVTVFFGDRIQLQIEQRL
jgi:hypothetical protein